MTKNNSPYRVLFLTKYGRKSANLRYRVEQYLPALNRADIETTIQSALDDQYLSEKFKSGKTRFLPVLRGFLQRCKAVAFSRNYDAVVILSEAYPYFPTLMETWLNLTGVPYVYDFDDAEFHRYDLHRSFWVRAFFKNKIAKVIKRADRIFAGNHYLESYAKKYNSKITILPTVVDMNRYSRMKEKNSLTTHLKVGWIGSPSTSQYLKLIQVPLAKFCSESGATLVAVGTGADFKLPGVSLDCREWSENEEIGELLRFDIGVMPLENDPWSRGKCGFKLIQYMACGLPVITSPVGMNSELVTHGVDGYHASTPEEWLEALRKLSENPELRRSMGEAGRKKIIERYSLQSTETIFVNQLMETFQSHRAPKR